MRFRLRDKFPVSLDDVSLLDLEGAEKPCPISPTGKAVFSPLRGQKMSTLYPHWGKGSWKLLPSETIEIDGNVFLLMSFVENVIIFVKTISQ